MPAKFSSERFVGRERELSHLAVALEAAADGRSPRLLVSGRGGVGVSRLVTEAVRRVGRLVAAVPGHPLHGGAGAWSGPRSGRSSTASRRGSQRSTTPSCAGSSDPGAEPIVAARCPAARAAARRRWSRMPAAIRSRPSAAARGSARRSRACSSGPGSASRSCSSSRTSITPTPATRGLATFLARVARPARLCLVLTYGRDRITRGHPLQAQLSAITGVGRSAGPAGAGTARPVRPRPARHRDRGRAADGRRAAPRRRALRRRPADRRGGARGPARAARPVARLHAGRARPGPARAPAPPRPGASCACSHRQAEPLDRGELAAVAATFEELVDGLPPRSTTRPRRGDGVLDADLRAGVVEALDHGFLVERADRRLEVRHELVAQAIEADLLPVQRRRHHLALAAALGIGSRLGPHPLARRLRAGARARGRAWPPRPSPRSSIPPADALAARELALELGAASGARAADGRLLFETADVALAAGRADRALAYLESAAGRFGEREDAATAASIYETLGRVLRALGDHDRALAEHRRAASIAPDGPTVLRASVLASLAQTLMLLGHFAEAIRVGAQAIEVARAVGPRRRARIEAHALCTVGVAQAWGAEPAATGIAQLQDALRLARELDDPDVCVPRHAQPDHRAGALRPARRGDRGHARGDRAGAPRRARGRLRQLDARQRRGGAVQRGPLGRGARDDPDGARVEPRRGRLRRGRPSRPRCSRSRRASTSARRACSAGGRSRSTTRPDPQLEVPATPRGRVVRAVARRRRRCPASRGARLGPGPPRRGLGARGADGRDLPRGPCRGRLRCARAARPARDHRRAPARQARPRRGRDRAPRQRRRAAARRAAWRPTRSLATARAFAARLDGRDDPVLWDAAAQALGARRRAVPGRAGTLAPGRGGTAGPRRSRGRGRRARAAPRGGPDRPGARRAAAPARARRTSPARALITLPAGAAGDGRPAPARSAATRGGRRASDRPWARRRRARTASRSRRAPGRGPRRGGRRRSIGHRRGVRAGRRAQAPEGGFGLSNRELEVLGADRRGPHEPRDRRAAVHQPEDRRRPRREHPVQARRVRPRGGGDGRDPPGAGARRRSPRGPRALAPGK